MCADGRQLRHRQSHPPRAERERGYAVYELSRHGADENGVVHLTADVTDEGAVEAALREILSREDHIERAHQQRRHSHSGAVELPTRPTPDASSTV
jgi:hypothetical protein